MTSRSPLSGPQFTLQADGYAASIAGVGASLRSLTYEGRDLVLPFDADQVRPAFRGAVLVPWPNRVVDGQFYFDGQHHELALTEPERTHALHGLAAWVTWDPVEVAADRVVLRHEIAPQSGYPFQVEVTVTYSLSKHGLSWEVSAVNVGSQRAPYGAAPHPYLIAGEGTVDEWTLSLPAEQVLAVTPDRLIPLDLHDVGSYDAGSLDFRDPRAVGGTFIDHAFTDIKWEQGRMAHVDLVARSGTGVRMSWESDCPWVQIHTPQAPGPDGWRSALAVEPMTCPPDAFNSGTDLVVLGPDQEHAVRWQISAL